MLRSYAGGVTGVLLTAPLTDLSTAATVSSTLGMPDGTAGPFSVVIGKGTPNEEKILVSTSGGGGLTFSQRGYDGTAARPHAAGEEVRLVITSIDAAEANAHVNATVGVHGLDFNDAVAGVISPQTFLNKTIDATANNIINLDPADSPLLQAAFDAETNARLQGDGLRYTKVEADSLFSTITARDAAIAAGILAHTSALDPHIQYLPRTEATSGFLPLVNGGLDPADVPESHTGRMWNGGVVADTATDASPLKTLGTISIPAASGPGQTGGLGSRLIRVVASVKGFTVGGVDGDVSRFRLLLRVGANGDWFGQTGEPQINRRVGGNTGVAADGVLIEGWLTLPPAQATTVTLRLEKISGVNPTNIGDGDCYFNAVQLV